MKRILIFSGTTEGRKLAESLSVAGIPAVVCVATEYGSLVMPKLSGIEVHQGRMDVEEMTEFVREGNFLAVVDATHPYAVIVSSNIKKSSQICGLSYIRLRRNISRNDINKEGGYFSDASSCAAALEKTQGNILLTTGSKDLAVFCERESLRERIYARVLPGGESIRLCEEAGIRGKHIIAMQGPFSEELNTALIHQFDIRCMVTKESGRTGGVPQKLSAAEKAGVTIFIIGEPEQDEGFSFCQVVKKLELLTGKKVKQNLQIEMTLVGTGMGSIETCTTGGVKAIQKADIIFGAARLLRSIEQWGVLNAQTQVYPYYLGKDIIPVIRDRADRQQEEFRAVVLFSGDSGFYSGCEKLFAMLREEFTDEEMKIHISPGISSVSYLAAGAGLNWQDAHIMSIHGKGEKENWQSELLETVRYHSKSVLIVSGAENVRETAGILKRYGMEHCRVIIGFQLSYPEEKIEECSVEECTQVWKEGLYTLMILNPTADSKYLAPKYRDEEFIRGKVPMTKEEVRSTVISKLQLTKDAVVYDIGSGTGSVAVETAQRSGKIRVLAVERKTEGVELIRQNAEKFGLPNITVVEGEAPDCLLPLPVPTHAFIGGSNGKLKEILNVLYRKNPSMRIVVTAVSMETVAEIVQCLGEYRIREEEMIQVQVSRSRHAGRYHLMQAENPVYICSFNFTS